MTSKPVLDVCPPTKRKKSNRTNVSTCLFCKEICNGQHTYTQKQWEALRLTGKEWSGLDRYGFVYSEVDCEKGTQDEQSFFREHVQGVTSKELDAVFIDHVQRTVCQLNETRILKGLLNDYHNFLFDLRGEEKVYKTSYIKTLISE